MGVLLIFDAPQINAVTCRYDGAQLMSCIRPIPGSLAVATLQEFTMFKKILVPTDGSALATGAATVAAQLAKSQGAQVVGVYVIDPFPFIGIGDASAVALQSYMTEARRAATQALDALSKLCAAEGVPFVGDTIERNLVHEGIVETANAEHCDLIVMGSHGRKGMKALLLGSVAHKVLVHAEVPVLTVKG
jgi:nucleotide-binding universal stress UspA family protein